jgi:hypothetical protein
MIIKIDVRESELIRVVKELISNIPSFKELEVIVETLPLGDIIISDKTSEKLIIERKSVTDLLSSIKDGRYEEQSYRLNGLNHHNHNIIYLIEGDINKANRFKDSKIEKLTLYSAIFSLNYYKGFSVLRTFNIEETGIYICNTANKIRKSLLDNRLPYYSNDINVLKEPPNGDASDLKESPNGDTVNAKEQETNKEIECQEKDYVCVVKKIKKDNITPDNIGEIMLCQIPGVSSVTALAVISKFQNISNLITSIQTDENCLNDISYTNAKNQQRKINKTSISNIRTFLLKK